jgi:hypothetical protein
MGPCYRAELEAGKSCKGWSPLAPSVIFDLVNSTEPADANLGQSV